MKVISWFIIFYLLLLSPAKAAEAIEAQSQSVKSIALRVLQGEVDMVTSSCLAAGVTLSSKKCPTTIIKVRLGSPALYAGVAEGDKVLSAQITDNKLCLLIERHGQRFSVQLKTSAQADNPLIAAIAQTQTNKMRTLTLKDIFASHDLALIIDRSGSMATPDCPGNNLGSTSRWQWCSQQSTDLAQVAASAASAITMTFFNHTYNVWKDVQPGSIPSLFALYGPEGNTLLSTPLQEQLNNYIHDSRRLKPLIIVILSDGMPQDSSAVASVLQEATKEVRYAGEITIVFLLIGTDMNEELLRAQFGELSQGSIKNGGMFDVIAFPVVSSKGFKQALLDEFSTAGSVVDTSKPSKAAEFATGQSIQPSMTDVLLMRSNRLQQNRNTINTPQNSLKYYIHQY